MNEQQLMKTIEDQNQVIIAKDATIDNLRKRIDDAKSELNELYLDRSWQNLVLHKTGLKCILLSTNRRNTWNT